MATKAEVGKALAATMPLFANYKPPRPNPDGKGSAEMDALVNAWLGMVAHLDAATFQAALQLVATRSEFFPTPALVLAAVTELTTMPARTGLEAWNEVRRAIAEHGVYHPPGGAQYGEFRNYQWDFSDPLVSRLIDGAKAWAELCLSENEIADRARFIDAYDKLQVRERDKARLTPDLLAFQDEHRAQLPAPTDRRKDIAQLMSGIGKGK